MWKSQGRAGRRCFPTVRQFQESGRKEAIEERMFNFYAVTDKQRSGCRAAEETQDLGENLQNVTND